MDLRLLRYFVVVAEERNVRRAAARLHMTQPPLSRALRRLEADLGVGLYTRMPSGVELTEAGDLLHVEAKALLDRADRVRARVQEIAGERSLVVGSLADTADLVGGRLVAVFRQEQPQVAVSVHEFDLSDPTAGLRAGRVDVALTREPFDHDGLRTQVLATQPVGLVVRDDDALAARQSVALADLPDRSWIQLPDGVDAKWATYWTVPSADAGSEPVRTIQECLQAVLWNGRSALAPVEQLLPPGLTVVPVTDREPNPLVLVWRESNTDPLVHAFVRSATASFR